MPALDRSRSPRFDDYDIIVIGSGAGGGTLASALADTSARMLILERGDFVPSEPENWDPAAVWKDLRYRTAERWRDQDGTEFQPYTHYNVGGNTKFWGSVLYRLRREDFGDMRHRDGVSPAWPIDYDTLEPYYERAERMYQVHGEAGHDPTEGARSPYPQAPIPACARDVGDHRAAEGAWPASVAAAPRPHSAGRGGWMPSVQHLQLVPLQASDEERCGGVRRRAGRPARQG
jgi:choline dehydrogenase-like flavoprotein